MPLVLEETVADYFAVCRANSCRTNQGVGPALPWNWQFSQNSHCWKYAPLCFALRSLLEWGGLFGAFSLEFGSDHLSTDAGVVLAK